jgi:hypothetical protein
MVLFGLSALMSQPTGLRSSICARPAMYPPSCRIFARHRHSRSQAQPHLVAHTPEETDVLIELESTHWFSCATPIALRSPFAPPCPRQRHNSAIDFAKYDVERANYGGDISEHVSARQEIHCCQMRE